MVATTTVAFLPIAFIESEESWIFEPLPIIIIAALFLSLFESFFLLPNHLRHFMPKGSILPVRRSVEAVRAFYDRVLKQVVRFRYIAVPTTVAIVGLALWLVTSGSVQFKEDDIEAYIEVFVELEEPAESLDQLGEKVVVIEKMIDDLPDGLVDYYSTRLGSAWFGGMYRGWKYAQIRIVPPGSYHEQEITRHEAKRLLEPQLTDLIGKRGFRRLLFRGDKGGEGQDIVKIYVSGGDRIEFTQIQDAIRVRLDEVEGIKDVFMDEARFQKSYRFDAEEDQLLAYSLTKATLREQLREHFSNQELLRLRHHGDEVEVYLKPKRETAPTLAELNKLSVVNAGGVSIPLKFFGHWQQTEVLRRIEHKDLLRLFEVDAIYDHEKSTAAEIAEAIERQLKPVRQAFPGYHVSIKPSEEEQKKKDWLMHLLIVCLALVYVCLVLSLDSLVAPIVVIFAIPFGLTGVVFAFHFHGLPLSIVAVIGIAGLAGVVVNDSLMMASTINREFTNDRRAGMRSAVLLGASKRFRAVMLTSLTTLGGVLPLAYGWFGDAGWIRPMVLALGWGLLFATILTLFFVPCVLLILDDGRRLGCWILSRLRGKEVSA